jgi:N-acetylglucosaminyldiphosphoundecaprenol N-acetyl-beta-D-mannosaminyltransferase
VRLLNIELDDMSMIELLSRFDSGFAWTPNADCMVKLHDDRELWEAVRDADFICADGKIVCWGAHFLGTPVCEKVSGSDLFPAYCEYHKDDPEVRIFLLGAGPRVAATAAEKINARVGREIIVATHSPSMDFVNDSRESAEVVDLVNASSATVLGVGLGAPKQEIWIARYRARLEHIRTFMALGATIDFEAGHIPRAPEWMRNAGLESLHRLLREPRRLWYRYLVYDMRFFGLVLKQRLGRYHNPHEEAARQ